jgi:hypothetical protein
LGSGRNVYPTLEYTAKQMDGKFFDTNLTLSTYSSKPQSQIFETITLSVYWSISGTKIILKCLTRRYDMLGRPRPIAPQNTISMIYLHSSVFRSYHPPYANHYLTNSKGGCAPYCSF